MTNTKEPGGYENLVVYWLGMTICDLTAVFCDKYMSYNERSEINRRSLIYLRYKTNKAYTRTYDQMIQAARSGKQNIVEGSLENSVEGNLKLTGVGRASFGELLEDYRDYLRQHNLPIWDKDDPRNLEIRRTRDLPNTTYKSYKPRFSPRLERGLVAANAAFKTYTTYTNNSEDFANLLITLCFKEGFLIDRLLKAIKDKFVREGGFKENLLKERLDYRRGKN